MSLAGALAVAAFAAVSFGGGMLGDRALPGPTGGAPELWGLPVSVYGVPAALILAAAGLRAASRGVGWRGGVGAIGVTSMLLAVWCIASLPGSRYLNAGLLHLGIVGLALAIAAIASNTASAPRAAVALAAAASCIAGLTALVGVAEYIERWEAGNASWRVFGPFVNPSFLAGYLLATTPVSLAALLTLARGSQPCEGRWAPAAICGSAAVGLAALLVASTGAGAVAARLFGDTPAAAAASVALRLLLAGAAAVAVVMLARLREPRLVAWRALTAAVAVSVTAQGACFLLTQSRTALLAAVGAGAVFVALVVWGRAVPRPGPRVVAAAAFLVLVPLLVGARPLLQRLQASAGQGYSAQFRVHTWRGALRMAEANPILGTGLGTFETAYPRYATVDYTQHAHNTYLHLAGEAGFPALLLLMAAVGGVAVTALRTIGRERKATHGEEGDPRVRGVLAAGVAAAIGGAAIHNLFDSALYVPACTASLAMACGLACGLARTRDVAPVEAPAAETVGDAAETRARARAQGWRLVCGAAAIVLAVRGVQMLAARSRMAAAESAVAGTRSDLTAGIAALREAAGLEPRNPEYVLRLASFLEADNRPSAALRACDVALEVARIGKTAYRRGQLLGRMGRWPDAVRAHELARRLEPRNLQNLLALAEAYRAAGSREQSTDTYRFIASLRETPFGRIRALPELVDWEFGIAEAEVAAAALESREDAMAAPHLDAAAYIFGEFWRTRGEEMTQLRVRPETRHRIADRYAWVLQRQAELHARAGRTGDARTVLDRLAKVQRERAEDEALMDEGAR